MDFSKYLGEAGLAELWNLMTAYVDGKIFIGTRAEYEANAANIAVGAMVIITDEGDVEIPPIVEKPEEVPEENLPDSDSTIAILGAAILGQMVLGRS